MHRLQSTVGKEEMFYNCCANNAFCFGQIMGYFCNWIPEYILF